jgi:type II secretory pathway pseudopilin PulG
VVTRAREESGFGLLELLMAMVMLNVGILAIVAAFNAGAVTLARASRISTATALADAQMELYRGLTYSAIEFNSNEWTAAKGDSTYNSDPVYTQNMTTPANLVPDISVAPCTGSPVPPQCDPSRVVSGSTTPASPDHRNYRVDTYLYYATPTGGGQLKTIAVVVRDGNDLTRVFARESSTFDPSTGQ